MLRIGKNVGIKLFCVVVLLSALAGCINSPAPGTPGGEAPAVISVWYSLQGKQEEQLLKEFQRISRKHPEILIKGEFVPEDRFTELAWRFQAGGEGPEIFIAGRPDILSLYEKGALAPLIVEQEGTFPSAKALFTFNQQSYAAPWLLDAPLLFYRADKTAPPVHLNQLWEKKSAVGIASLNLALLSPWWKAEGGTLSLAGVPALDSAANTAFLTKLQVLESEGLLVTDPKAIEKFISGEINYLIAWASQGRELQQAQINWECISLYTVLGENGNSWLDKSMAVANSSIKSTPALEDAIRIVQEELLSLETETELVKAGGQLPANVVYYEGAAPSSLNSEAAVTFRNALTIEGNLMEWKLFDLMGITFNNIAAGKGIEAELRDSQLTALEMVKTN